jgi:hypothetical protein
LSRETLLPASVRGPVLLWAFAPLAACFADVTLILASSPRRRFGTPRVAWASIAARMTGMLTPVEK